MSDKKKKKPEAEAPAENTPEEKVPEENTPDTRSPEAPAEPEKKEPTPEELLAAEKDKYVRLYAEYENYRRRSQKEREALYAQVKTDAVTPFLPVYDNLERALKTGCSDEAFLKGVQMTMTQLEKVLEGLGVRKIEAVGQKFDAKLHNAVMHVDDENYGENEVVEEFQKGFTLGEKVIRFSMVKVAN